MTQLEDCYFCGTVEDTLESYPVIPPGTYPPEDAQRTVVLCPTCREKLARALDPVVEYFEPPEPDGADERDGGYETEEASDDPDEDAGGERSAGRAEADTPEQQAGESAREGRVAEREERIEEGKPSTGAGADARERSVELPDGTENIVRLLRNREFPVERGDIVTVAANAYGIGREESDAAIDALIEHGWLTERDGELHRTG